MSLAVEFLKKCINLPTGHEFAYFVDEYILTLHGTDISREETNIYNYLKTIESSSTVAMGVNKCLEYCNGKANIPTFRDDKNLLSFIQTLKEISRIIENYLTQANKAEKEQTDMGNLRVAIDSYDKKLKEFQQKLDSTQGRIEEQSSLFDSKVFQLLINTIAILGIFVAIAVAGFGGTSIIANVSIDLSVDFLKGIFSVFLIVTFIYNLLYLLFYFLVQILEKFYSGYKKSVVLSESETIKYTPLWIIDGILLLITLVLFIVITVR